MTSFTVNCTLFLDVLFLGQILDSSWGCSPPMCHFTCVWLGNGQPNSVLVKESSSIDLSCFCLQFQLHQSFFGRSCRSGSQCLVEGWVFVVWALLVGCHQDWTEQHGRLLCTESVREKTRRLADVCPVNCFWWCRRSRGWLIHLWGYCRSPCVFTGSFCCLDFICGLHCWISPAFLISVCLVSNCVSHLFMVSLFWKTPPSSFS